MKITNAKQTRRGLGPPSKWEDFRVAGELSDEKLSQLERELGGARKTRKPASDSPGSGANMTIMSGGGLADLFGFGPQPWKHTSHVFGFLPPAQKKGRPTKLVSAGDITPDPRLMDARINVKLNALRIAGYPGGGVHQVLFDFYAENQLPGASEQVHFNMRARAREGESVAVIGVPIFIGLCVGKNGVAFECATVNVKNDQDEKLLSFLDSDAFKNGLLLAETAQPALVPFSQLAVGLTKAVGSRNRNVPVQRFKMGLDFDGTQMGARLAEGDYVVVQVSAEDEQSWNWNDWQYQPDRGRIVHAETGAMMNYNYVAFGVSRFKA